MYEIIAMDNTGKECVIYNDKANNTDYKVENPKLIMAEDTAGSLNFKIPPTHPHYDTLDPMKTLLKVIREDECIWAGRITEMRMDLWDQKEITCEGVLGFLNDTVQEPGILKDTVAYDPKKILQLIINRHNTQIQKADGGVPNKHKTFTVGVVNVYEDPNDTLTPDDEDTNWYTDWNTSWDALNQILFERYPKGHLRCQWRKDDGETEESWHIDYISQENYSTSEQTIEFGKNLINFTRNYTMTNLKTVCLPRGAVLEDQSEYVEGLNRRLGVTTVNNIANGETSNYNDQFIRITQAVPDSTALEDMGWIVQEVVWDEVSDKTKLKKRAKKWLREEQFDNMVIEINAVDMHYLNPSIKSADILTKIRCISKPHGMDREFPITKIEITLDKPESSKITLGSSKQRSFTGSTVGKNRDTDKEVSDIWKKIDNMDNKATIEYPQWATGTWAEIFAALTAHHEGLIDLYRDYGWRPGDRRTVHISEFTSPDFTTFDGDDVGHVKNYTEAARSFDFVLVNRGEKIMSHMPMDMVRDSDDTYKLVPDETKAVGKECAFVVAVIPNGALGALGHYSNITYSSSNANHRAIAIPNGLPYYDQGASAEQDNWETSWIRQFLESFYDHIDINETIGNVKYKTENIFMPIKTPILNEIPPEYMITGQSDEGHLNFTYVYDKATLPTITEMRGTGDNNAICRSTALNGDGYISYSVGNRWVNYTPYYNVERRAENYQVKHGAYKDYLFDYYKTPANRKFELVQGVWLRGEPGKIDTTNLGYDFAPTYNSLQGTTELITFMPMSVKGKLWWTRTGDISSGYNYSYDRWPSCIPILCI